MCHKSVVILARKSTRAATSAAEVAPWLLAPWPKTLALLSPNVKNDLANYERNFKAKQQETRIKYAKRGVSTSKLTPESKKVIKTIFIDFPFVENHFVSSHEKILSFI